MKKDASHKKGKVKYTSFTPRQRVVYHAVLRNIAFPYWTSHEAIEDVVSGWRHKGVCSESVEYYMNVTDKQLERLCNEVEKKASVKVKHYAS